MEDTDTLMRNAQSKVSSTISALEAAIASYEAMDKKPEKYADTIASMRKLLAKLEAWERTSLLDYRAEQETKKKHISELIIISESSKGDF